MPKQYGRVTDPSSTTLPFWTRNLHGRIGQGRLANNEPGCRGEGGEEAASSPAPATAEAPGDVGSHELSTIEGEESPRPRPGSLPSYDGSRWEHSEAEERRSTPSNAEARQTPYQTSSRKSPNLAKFRSLGEPLHTHRTSYPAQGKDSDSLPLASLERVQQLHAATGLDPAYYATRNRQLGIATPQQLALVDALAAEDRPSFRPPGCQGIFHQAARAASAQAWAPPSVGAPAAPAAWAPAYVRMRVPRRAW